MKKYIVAAAVALAAIMPATAKDFFSTEKAPKMFDFGARIGVNTSNITVANAPSSVWNQNSWGTGFDLGVVANINFVDFISVQPGFFFESRSGSYSYINDIYLNDSESNTPVMTSYPQAGKGRQYFFTIPIVGSVHFNVLDWLRWNVDLGPYFQFKLSSSFDKKFHYFTNYNAFYTNVKTSKADVGIKIGTSVDIYKHYYVGVHYMAGFCHAWNYSEMGGHNKAWVFTIGYNL